ncbi:GNAT family N-acetyltransferase [Lacipirellula parvula]|nr:GNAT family N-acetyltransferase [Lacipirellula parvula]
MSTVKVEQIDASSPRLTEVKSLWRQHSDTLGFFPDDAFHDYAHSRRILVAIVRGKFAGYLLYRLNHSKAVIVHLCVDANARQQGVTHALLDQLRSLAKDRRGILLKCRQDFDVSATWPRLGFARIRESAGRASKGSTLIHWWLDFGTPDLFDQPSDSDSLDAAIDANIFLDLMEDRNDETSGLMADWLHETVALCYTAELLNDLGRSNDEATRLQRRAEASQFKLLRCTPEDYHQAEAVLKPLFPKLPTPQDESDFRHLVRASASGANVFVTRDQPLLDQSQAVFDACGLSIVRPSELIGRVDTLLQEKQYQRRYVAGTKQISQTRISQLEQGLVQSISRGQESQRNLTSRLNCYLANPKLYECHSLANAQGETLAFYVLEKRSNQLAIPLLRVRQNRQAGTLLRYLLTGIVRRAILENASSVFLPESEVADGVEAACASIGFLPVDQGHAKIVLSGLLSAAQASELIPLTGASIDQLREALGQAATCPSTASIAEHLIWPAKIVDSALPCFIVPIRPSFAEHLFDEGLASDGLFGADVDLALNPESAYYRAARPGIITCPSRVLWYVSSSQTYTGSMSIRACSRVVELAKGTPKHLFQRFRRLGVYDWQDVLKTASGDLNKEIMAFRFDDSEPVGPIPLSKFQPVLRAHGVRTQLQSPVKIRGEAFAEIYALAFDTPEVR